MEENLLPSNVESRMRGKRVVVATSSLASAAGDSLSTVASSTIIALNAPTSATASETTAIRAMAKVAWAGLGWARLGGGGAVMIASSSKAQQFHRSGKI